ncbi:hypothetical protein FRB94_001746 [Tulasnella sp. JGI-2019a]|nr:hypothetical protein FRB94_001746 [Tulasnella sp. JGI-2019a]
MSTATTMTITELGGPVPSLPHAISVSLPTWKDNVDYEEGAARVLDSMKTGYPRFFIHKSIQKLSKRCQTKFGQPGESCLLFPNATVADACRSFIRQHSTSAVTIRLVQYTICAQQPPTTSTASNPGPSQSTENCIDLHVVFFPSGIFPLAKQFWQHTGDGISSRMAEACLEFLAEPEPNVGGNTTPPRQMDSLENFTLDGGVSAPVIAKGPSRYKPQASRYNANASFRQPAVAISVPSHRQQQPSSSSPNTPDTIEGLTSDHTVYLEERYGRNLPISSASIAKRALRRRIAGVLLRDSNTPTDPVAPLGEVEVSGAVVGESWRGVRNVKEDDVFLFPTGMSAIWHAHQLLLESATKAGAEPGKSVSFGFPYTDTLKILQKWGPGCHFLGHGLDSDIPTLHELLRTSSPPILALFCEFPSNPLLRSPNLARLRELADEFGFAIVVDETIGNFVNVDVLKYADVVVSSITKVFSGETNVMGGAMILNPQAPRYKALRENVLATYEDNYWPEDSLYMERNSRDFQRRINIINRNAECIAELLRDQSVQYHEGDDTNVPRVVQEVFYPKWVTRENYDACKNPHQLEGSPSYPSGYGGLLSITFTSPLAGQVFFDNLGCEKGPSLGTSFTLACPYAVLAHYNELEWAESWGVDRGLVRVSVGLEDQQKLLDAFNYAVRAAEEAVRTTSA